MAIDSAEDRRSAAAVCSVFMAPGITMNAAKDVEWRQQSAWSYSGIGIGTPSTAELLRVPFVYRRRMNRLRSSKRTR